MLYNPTSFKTPVTIYNGWRFFRQAHRRQRFSMSTQIQSGNATHPQESISRVGEVDVGELLAVLVDHRWLLAGIFIGSLIFSTLYALLAPSVYRADALVQVDSQSSSLPGLGEMSELFGEQTSSSTEVELLKSRRVLGEAIDTLNLTSIVKNNYFPLIGRKIARIRGAGTNALAKPLLGLSSFAWSNEELVIGNLDLDENTFRSGERIILTALGNGKYSLADFDGNQIGNGEVNKRMEGMYRGSPLSLRVMQLKANPKTNFEIILKTRVTAINEIKERIKVTENGKDTGIISLVLEGTDPQQIQSILDTVVRFYVRTNVEQRSEEAAKMLEFVELQLPELKAKLDAAELRLYEYQKTSGRLDISLETRTAVEKITSIESSLSELELKKMELSQKFTEQHPSLVILSKQREQLLQEKSTLEGSLQALPESEREFIQLTRDVSVATELYITLLNRGQELKVAKSGTVGNVRVIDNAERLENPVKPKIKLILLFGALFGLVAGLAAVILKTILNRGMSDPQQIENLTGIPVYASVGHSAIQAKSMNKEQTSRLPLLAQISPNDLAIEALRSLRTSLQFNLMSSNNNLVVITGAAPGIGKSFISANLTSVLGDGQKKVLLIDADMRKGYTHKYFNTKKEPGLSGLITNAFSPKEVIRNINDYMDFIPTGHFPPNPSELLMSANFEKLLSELSTMYDIVVIDTPPILAVTDASIVARLAGTLLFVLKSGIHPAREIELAIAKFRHNDCKVDGVILNDVPVNTTKYGTQTAYQYSYK